MLFLLNLAPQTLQVNLPCHSSAYEKKESKCFSLTFLFRDPDRIQTCNLLIRSQMLYSVELRDRL